MLDIKFIKYRTSYPVSLFEKERKSWDENRYEHKERA